MMPPRDNVAVFLYICRINSPVMDVNIEKSWKEALSDEFEKPYFGQMVEFLHKRKSEGAVIYPRGNDISALSSSVRWTG